MIYQGLQPLWLGESCNPPEVGFSAPVGLTHLASGHSTLFQFDCCVDTGASGTIVPMSIFSPYAYAPDKFSKGRDFFGLEIDLPVYYVKISIDGLCENLPLEVHAHIRDDILLGRNFFTAISAILCINFGTELFSIHNNTNGHFRNWLLRLQKLG